MRADSASTWSQPRPGLRVALAPALEVVGVVRGHAPDLAARPQQRVPDDLGGGVGLVALVVDGVVAVRDLQQAEVAGCQQVVDGQGVQVVRVVDVGDATLCQDLLDRPADAARCGSPATSASYMLLPGQGGAISSVTPRPLTWTAAMVTSSPCQTGRLPRWSFARWSSGIRML